MVMKTIAIDVALLLPTDVEVAAANINAHLSRPLTFDETHLPHLTVVQQFVEVSKLERAVRILGTIAKGLQPIEINVRGIGVEKFDNTCVLYWVIESSLQLRTLHHRVSADFGSLACRGSRESFFSDEAQSIPDSTIDYVDNFCRQSSGSNFGPHITLGFGDVKLQQKPFTFTASRIAICHLGELNTCRRVLYEQRLRARVRRTPGRRQAKQSV
jgi:2'-5' RNA ligase